MDIFHSDYNFTLFIPMMSTRTASSALLCAISIVFYLHRFYEQLFAIPNNLFASHQMPTKNE